MTFKALLLSPYDAVSHRYWRQRLLDVMVAESLETTVVTLPARYFSWRFRGNSLTLSQDERLSRKYDLIIATSMTDFATLRGLQPAIGSVPSILYFHENQFAYPDNQPERQVERQITSIYSALAADRLVFNTRFNQQTFLAGVSRLLAKLPDGVPPGVDEMLAAKSSVISVPIDIMPERQPSEIGRSQPLSIVWNHRWEHDKGLVELKKIVAGLVAQNQPFKFHLIGQQFRIEPQEIAEIKALLGDRLGYLGFVQERQEYLELLARSHVVLSTARHEFQGIAVLEAMAAGARPVVPDDLAYRELIPAASRYASVEEAVQLILSASDGPAPPLPDQVNAGVVASQWQTLIRERLESARDGKVV